MVWYKQASHKPTQIRQTWERHPTDLTSSLRKVAFVQKEYTTPVFRVDSREFKPKYQFQKLIKSGLDPFLRNINSKMPFRKKKGQGAHRSPSISSADDAEHEDQDPPYTEHSRSAGSHTPWAEDPNLATTHLVHQKSNLPPEHTTTNTMIADRKNTWSLDPTLSTTETSDMKKIFISDHPVYTITKLSDTDYKLSTDPSSNTPKASDTRLSSVHSSNTAKPSDTRLSSAPSSNTPKPSDTRLSSVHSSNTAKPSDTRLSSVHSSNTAKPSDTRLSSVHSSNTAKASDTRLSSVHSSNTAKPSDTRLSSVHSSNTAKPSDTRLSSVHSSNTAKPSDTRLSSVHSSNTAKPSDTRLSSVHSSNTAKASDTRLSSVHSSNTAKASDTRLSSVHSSNTAKPSDTMFSSVHSSNTAKPSDTRLSSVPSSNMAKPSDTRLSSAHSSNTAKPSDTRLSSVHSSNTPKPSDTRLSSASSSNTAKPSDTRLSSVHSSNTAKPSDTMLSSVHSSNTAKPSDTRLSSVHSSNTAKPSDTRLSSVHSSNTAKPSDTRLSSVHSSNTAKPSDTRLSSVHSSNTAKPSDTRLSSVHSSNTAKPSDTMLSSVHSSNTAKPSDTRLSSAHSSNTAKPSDTRLSSTHSSNTAKPSDRRPSSVPSSNMAKPSDTRISSAPSSSSSQTSVPGRFPHNPSIISTKSSDSKNTLSQDPSNILTKPSDVSIVSHDSSNTAKKSSDTSTSSRVLSIISTQSLDSKNKLPGGNPTAHSDLTPNTVRTPASRDKLVRDPAVFTVYSLDMQLPNVPFPNYQKESSSPENVNIYHPSSPTKLTSNAENRRPSIALKSVFSRNLQDLSDELFSKPDAGTNSAEAIRGSSSLSLSVRDRPSNGVEDKVFEKVQDIKNWLSSKDILNSQALLSPVVKSVPQGVFPEGGPGTSSDIEGISGKPLEAAEINFPSNRKSSFKTKHLVNEVSSSSLGLNGGVYEHIIKQIFTGPLLSHLEAGMALSEAQTALQKQLLASSERSSSSQIDNYEEDSNEVPLSPAKSSISRILQSFPVETLLESGMISVTELEEENQSSLLDGQTASPEDKVQNPTEQHSNVQSQTKLLSRQTTPTTQPTETFVSGAHYQRVDKQSDFLNEQQHHLDTEETGLSSTLETLSSSFMGKLKDIDAVMLKSFLKNIFRAFFKYNQLEKELDRLISHSAPHGAEHLEKIQADREDRKATLDPKLCGLLEKLSESEVKTLKVELGKHIQHYIIERLSEVGHITKEDLPKVYGNLGQMSEKAEAKEPSPPQDKYSETIKEVMSFMKSFNHHFIDKHLETKLRSFLNEILQKCFLRNLSGSNLFNEADSMALCPSMSSLRSKSTPRCLPELEQDIAGGGLGSKLKINMKYPLSESLQNCLNVLPENELLGLKTDLNKYVQVLFIEKLQKSGLITEKQLEGISQQVNSLDSFSRSLNYTKPDLPLRDESYFMREDSEKQKKYSKVCQNPMSPTFLEDPCGEKELTQEEEKGGSFSYSLKENPPAFWEHKHVYSREVKTVIKVQTHPNKNIQANPLNKSPERLADLLLKKHQKDHGFMQLPQAENSVYKAETQESYSWDGRSKPIQSKLCFEKTLRAKSLDKRESNNICKLLAQEKPDTGLPPYLKLPTSKMSRENEHLNRLPFPTWLNNTFLYVNTESGKQSKLDKYCQKWKGNNNNNKKHLVTFAQFKNEMETLYTNPYEACREKCTKISESPPLENKEDGRNSRPSFFPEVLKRENMRSKRRDYTVKPKKSFYKLVRILPATLPTRPHLRKSVPRTLLHWTARRTIHDCLDRFDDLHMPSVKHPKNSKSRARLLGKSPDDPHNQAKHCARPFTAPEPNKGRESVAGKFASPRMVSAGLVHIHDTNPQYEIRKIQSKRKLKENIEKRPLICDIIQMLDTIG
ncbi:cation channel sperm-associated targeting subunit tau-like [Alexandromys fortis]|uniref:cation channel sperm-associated targeting subunit tau-like n=1 Tax=Alexandromys fortis TaxID=100897 RepID=UPI0021520A1F|nr:cation channel sperm-associated targeting subunit tau-like [Microtus fortis]